MPRLTDTQAVLLSSAAQRADGHLLPVPKTLTAAEKDVAKAIAALVKGGLAREMPALATAQVSRMDGEDRVGAVITDAGRIAIGVEPESDGTLPDAADAGSSPPSTAPAYSTKAALVLSLLRREQGATLAELIEATGWLPHTARAALTGIRKKGHAVAKGKRDDVTCYTLAA